MFVGHLSAANRGHSPPLSSSQVDLPPSPAHHATGAYLRIAANRNVSRINAAAAASHGAPVVHDLHQLLAAPCYRDAGDGCDHAPRDYLWSSPVTLGRGKGTAIGPASASASDLQ